MPIKRSYNTHGLALVSAVYRHRRCLSVVAHHYVNSSQQRHGSIDQSAETFINIARNNEAPAIRLESGIKTHCTQVGSRKFALQSTVEPV